MKILYVTRDLPDGDLVEHELVRLLPQVRISVSASVDDACARVSTLGAADVLLLDHGSLGPDLIELVGRVRAAGPVPVIIALNSPAERSNGDKLVQAGVDESLVKSAGYLERLTRAIGRLTGAQERGESQRDEERLRLIVEQMPACLVMIAPDGTIMALNWSGLPVVGAQSLEQVVGKPFVSLLPEEVQGPFISFLKAVCAGRPGSFRFNWTGLDHVMRQQELRGVPFQRDPGASAILLGVIGEARSTQSEDLRGLELRVRETDENLKAAEARSAELERELRTQQGVEARIIEKIRALRGEWDTARQDLEKRLREAEEQRAALQASLETARTGEGEQTKDRDRWERMLQDLESRVVSAEAQCASLGQALQAARLNSEQASSQVESEREQWQTSVDEAGQRVLRLEQEHAALQACLEAERASWAESRRQIEGEALAAAAARSAAESALADAVALRDILAGRLEAEREDWAQARQQFEAELRAAAESRSAAENALAAALAAQQELVGRAEQERAEWNESRREMERQLQHAADARGALESALEDENTARRAAIGQVEWERAQWASARQKLEQKVMDAMQAAADAEAVRAETRSELEDRAARLEEQVAGLTAILSVTEESRPAASPGSDGLEEGTCCGHEENLRAVSDALAEKSVLVDSLQSEVEALRGALREAETARPGVEQELREVSLTVEQLQLEKAQWDSSQADTEERRMLAEAERAGLEEAFREAQQAQSRSAEDLRAERGRLAAERAERREEQDTLERLRAESREMAPVLEKLRAAHAELAEARQADRARLETLSAEADRLRADREEIRRQLLHTGTRYRDLIRKRSESFRQTLNGTVARLQQIAEIRIALLTAQHREELERLQQLVREGNLRREDLDALLAEGEQAEKKIAAESGGSAG